LEDILSGSKEEQKENEVKNEIEMVEDDQSENDENGKEDKSENVIPTMGLEKPLMSPLIQSKSDKRQYKFITLPNSLKCLLVSDPEADKSAASLDVHVGCALDKKPLYGTAHFLEHMLFMGTKKYPGENEYSEFIKNNGGSNNAYTSLTNTNYHFDVSNQAFNETLDRFAQFFISPLLSESGA
jgi:secreted Zn-dependent insulinase-like peptidase